MPTSRSTHFFRLALILVLLLAFGLRLYNLHLYPPGASPDEAGDVIDILNIRQANFHFPLYEDYAIPEPLQRWLYSLLSVIVGNSVWSIRFLGVCAGVITVALTAWAARCCFAWEMAASSQKIDLAPLVILLAAAVLALSPSHIVISRAIYRAILQPIFMLLTFGWLLRGVATDQRRYFVLSGISLALTLYSYTAGMVTPAALALLALQLLWTRPQEWRRWFVHLLVLGVVFALCVGPLAYAFLTRPQFVIGRALELNSGEGTQIGWGQIEALLRQLFVAGDVNPQYNIDHAPLVPPLWVPFFLVGLFSLCWRLRQPVAILLLGWLALATIPVLSAGEVPHGLRIMGLFAVFPLITGLGGGVLWQAVTLVRRPFPAASALRYALWIATVLIAAQTYLTASIYFSFWQKTGDGYTWSMYGRQLPIADWFFRPDRRDLAQWIIAQQTPLLIPRQELDQQTTHGWLAATFPNVQSADQTFQPPAGTRIVAPWSLEAGDFVQGSRHYALLHEGIITLLPPLSPETRDALRTQLAGAETLTRRAAIEQIGAVAPLPPTLRLNYEPTHLSNNGAAWAIFNHELALEGWHGPETISPAGGGLVYTLDWRAQQRPSHFYSSYLQLQTQEGERLAGDDVVIGRWLLPPPFWSVGASLPDVHQLPVPPDLPTGAYKLVAGLYVDVANPLLAVAEDGAELGDSVLLGWVKVPMGEMPSLSEPTRSLDARVGAEFALRRAHLASQAGALNVQLEWQALTHRPTLDATIFVQVFDDQRQLVAQQDSHPSAGVYPTLIWDLDEIVVTTHQLAIPSVPGTNWQVYVGMYTFPDLARLAVVQDGMAVAENWVSLGEVR